MRSIWWCAPRRQLMVSMTLSVLLLPCGVWAQAPSPWGSQSSALVTPAATHDDAASLARLRSVLTWYETLELDRRRTVGIVGSISGGLAIAGGFVYWLSDREATRFAGLLAASMGVGTLLGVVINMLAPSPFAPVREAMIEGDRTRRSAAEVREATERVWRERAERGARARTAGSTLTIIMGGATMLLGGVMLAVDVPSSRGRELLRFSGGGMIGLGTAIAVAGAALRFTPEPLEQSWEVYQRTAPHLGLGVSAVPGGATAGIGGTF